MLRQHAFVAMLISATGLGCAGNQPTESTSERVLRPRPVVGDGNPTSAPNEPPPERVPDPLCSSLDLEPLDPSIRVEPSSAFEAFEQQVKKIGERRKPEVGRESWHIRSADAATCAGWLGRPLPEPSSRDFTVQGDCSIEFQLDGNVAVIAQNTECGGDLCNVDRFIWRADADAPEAIAQDYPFAQVEVAHGGDVYITDDVIGAARTVVRRHDRRTGAMCVITESCFSPRLTPDQGAVLCRDTHARVLSVPSRGGDVTELVAPQIPDGRSVRVRWQWGVYPRPPRFETPQRILYDLWLDEDPTAGELALDL